MFGLHAQRWQVPGDMVGKAPWLVNIEQCDHHFRWDILRGVRDLLELTDDRAHQRFGFQCLHGSDDQRLQRDPEKGIRLQPLRDTDALFTFQHNAHGAVRDLQDLNDLGDDTDLVQLLRVRVLRRHLPLRG